MKVKIPRAAALGGPAPERKAATAAPAVVPAAAAAAAAATPPAAAAYYGTTSSGNVLELCMCEYVGQFTAAEAEPPAVSRRLCRGWREGGGVRGRRKNWSLGKMERR